jgi:hypothetical protein
MVEDQFALLLAIGLSIINLKSLSDRKVYIRNLGVPVTMYSYYGSGGSMSKVAGLLTTHTSLSPIRRGFAPDFVDYKKGAFDSQPPEIKFTSYLPMVGGSSRVLLFWLFI